MNYLYYISFIFYILLSFKKVFTEDINVYEKDDFLSSLNKNENIIINNSIHLNQTIEIPSHISTICISGKDNLSYLIFGNEENSFHFIFNNQKKVVISNLNIVGHLSFIGNNNIILKRVNVTGSIQTSKMEGNALTISESNIFITNEENTPYENGIYLMKGKNQIINTNITCSFYNKLKNLLYFSGNNDDTLNIISSIFNGKNSTSGIKVTNRNINIESSKFIDLYSPTEGITMNKLFFENNMAENMGGSIYLENNYDVNGNNLEGYNIYAGYTGGFINIKSHNINNNHDFLNITVKNDWNVKKSTGSGLILRYEENCANLYSHITLKNVYGSDFYCNNSPCSIFRTSGNTELDIENVNINNVHGTTSGIFFESFVETNSESYYEDLVKVKKPIVIYQTYINNH
ncbi:hypothetical protein PIROE2DRAFT_4198 [Piromyces sp. E2]|nr:hypothetical protein PIROE2DRAFT_4198 [Piromyces sp. E2]|eukprot:OUM68192.1 hypothetical protein PIROE2DRAFT_4198 [Piromyces sp. E2]